MTTSTKNEEKFMTDVDGHQIPVKYVSVYDRKRDRIAQKIYKRWKAEEARLALIRAETLDAIAEVKAMAEKDVGVSLGGAKGYMQFRSFDGKIIVRFENVKQIEFDERLAVVQQLIGEAIAEMTQGFLGTSADDIDLKEIAAQAFRPRRSSGKLDIQRVRDLANYKVKHPKWKKAVSIIRECETTIGHRQYIRVGTKASSLAPVVNIELNISNAIEAIGASHE